MASAVMSCDRPIRPWSDWLGCVFFTAFAVFLLWRAPGVGLMMLPTIAHELLTAATFVLRNSAKARLGGIVPRLAAYGATFIVPAFIMTATVYQPAWLQPSTARILLIIGCLCWLLGTPLVLAGIWKLRHSFSIEPQARQLVTSGPYVIARHPIYTGYLLQYLAIVLTHCTPAIAVVFFAWLGLVWIRIRYEEKVLGLAFPEYAIYKTRVGMFGPKLYGRGAPRKASASISRPPAKLAENTLFLKSDVAS